jgi:hypothetical protein
VRVGHCRIQPQLARGDTGEAWGDIDLNRYGRGGAAGAPLWARPSPHSGSFPDLFLTVFSPLEPTLPADLKARENLEKEADMRAKRVAVVL